MKALLSLDEPIRFIHMSEMNQSIAGAVRTHIKMAQAVKDALLNIRSGNQTLFYQNVNAIARALVWAEHEAGRGPGSGQKHFPDGSSIKFRLGDGTSAGFNPQSSFAFNSHPLAEVMLKGLGQVINNSDPIFVSEEVMSLITTAAETMEPEPLYETDLLSPHGLIIFETPIIISDFHPITGIIDERIKLAVRAISWMTSSLNISSDDGQITSARGIHMTIYTDGGAAGKIYIDSYNSVAEQDGLPDEMMQEALFPNGSIDDLVGIDYHGWAFGRNWASQESDQYSAITDYPNLELISTISFIRRFFLTLMRFAWQEIITPTPTNDIPRPDRRAVERMFGKKENLISVLRLRRARNKAEAETEGYTLQWRVVVRGHWRRQYYPSMGPVESPDSHRLIWINPHIKGPDNAPVRYNHKVTAIVR